ncbi:hypothetical protein QCM8_213 [Bacillus phage QCM8]|nr:hypothetical protein QCM8_213 [Bacillus phage QCM8]
MDGLEKVNAEQVATINNLKETLKATEQQLKNTQVILAQTKKELDEAKSAGQAKDKKIAELEAKVKEYHDEVAKLKPLQQQQQEKVANSEK